MTVQVNDKVIFADIKYEIIEIDNQDIERERELQKKLVGFGKTFRRKGFNCAFFPQNYGMNPGGTTCSACWRGYICSYVVTEEQLHVDALELTEATGFYPAINGVFSRPCNGIFDQRYEGMNLPLAFNGMMEIGRYVKDAKNQVNEYTLQSEFFLTFQNGTLISTITKEEMDERRRIYIETHKDEINAKLAKLLGDTTQVATQVATQGTTQDARAEQLLDFCTDPRTRDEMQQFIGILNREHFRKVILKPLLASGKLRMTIPDKPNSRNQKYIRA